jgi:penicillin-binding protein 2
MTFCFFVMGTCLLRLGYLQIIRGRAFVQASENNHTQVLVERAPRGRILDRNGEVLADDRPVFVALFSPLGLGPADFQRAVGRLSVILEVPPNELERRLFAAVRAKSMMRISDRLTRAQAFRILQDRPRLPGISLTIEEQRYYPKEVFASHLLGYVGQITEDELEKFAEQGYHSGDWIGKSGLERLYDPSLHGQDGGFLTEIDARGRQVRVVRHLLPQAGKDLVLTIDYKLEKLAEEQLRSTGLPGAAVVLNPQTGEVLALASSPGFNPNIFLPLGDSEERKRLLRDPELPLYNRTIQALYPPGSTFKIVSSLAALEGHRVDPAETIYCNGSYSLGKERRIFHCWKPKGHGSISFLEGLAQSCDVYFYHLGQRTGSEAIEKMAKLFGLGQLTGIDLPHEKRWALPLAWKEAHRQHWQGGDTLNYAIGQGLLQVTPLQMANLIAAVANGGSLWQPYLVAEARHFGEKPERLGSSHRLGRIAISNDALDLVRKGLLLVVQSGTGAASKIKGVDVAGKTGTAQASKGKDHAWFVAYAPAENPQVACAVVVEHGGHGGSMAAPIAHDLLALELGRSETEGHGEELRTESD